MFKEFFLYFISFIIKQKTRQNLLFLAIIGLVLSSFALIVLQSTMNGLQNKVKGRSKVALGLGIVKPKNLKMVKSKKIINQLIKELHSTNANAILIPELELEMLLKKGAFLSPVVVHGIDFSKYSPQFFKKKIIKELLIGESLAYSLNLNANDTIRILSPSFVDSFLGDIPKMASLKIDSIFQTNVGEIDQYHIWVDYNRLLAITNEILFNRVRIYGEFNPNLISPNILKNYQYVSWEEKHKSLIGAFELENKMILFLFISMTFLVGISISSGLIIFFSKIKTDLVSFWILGTDKKRILMVTTTLLQLICIWSISFGVILGLLFLYMLDVYAPEIMPAIFIDRKIPVFVTARGILLSFFIPYILSSIFIFLSMKEFRKNTDYLSMVRSIGR